MDKNKEKKKRKLAPFFIRRKSLPIWISCVTVSIIIVFLYGHNYEITDEEQAVSFLNTNAGLLVTILAVTLSFTVLGLQFLAESYTPRALADYLKDRIVFGFPILYISLISLNLISAAVPSILSPIKFLQFAVIGTVFSLVYLVAFAYHIIRKIQPERIIFETSKTIPADAWKQIVQNEGKIDLSLSVYRPFMILEQIMIKAINNNDIFTFVQGLSTLFKRMEIYLGEIQKEFQLSKNTKNQTSHSGYIYKFFFVIFSPLISESLTHGREQFVIQYQWHMFNQIKILYDDRNHRSMRDFWEHLDYVGHKIFHLEMISASELYLRQLDQLMKLELSTVKKTIQVSPKNSLGYAQRSDDEIVDRILTHDFDFGRIGSLTDFGIIASEKRMEYLPNMVLNMLRQTLEVVLTIPDGVTRRSITYSILRSFEKIHEISINKGTHSNMWTTGWLEHYVEKIDKRYANDAKMITETLCKLSLSSIKHGDYFEISQLGINCRLLADSYPDLVVILLNNLEKCFEIVKNESDTEKRTTWLKEITAEVESAEKWNKKKHSQITTRVKEILAKNPVP